MATAKANPRAALAVDVIRPALVEAKLMTAKRARDAVYVATLAEELRSIEGKLAALEESMHLVSLPEGDLALGRAYRPPQDGPDAHWIRTKSSELTQRLRRIEQSVSLGSRRNQLAGQIRARAAFAQQHPSSKRTCGLFGETESSSVEVENVGFKSFNSAFPEVNCQSRSAARRAGSVEVFSASPG